MLLLLASFLLAPDCIQSYSEASAAHHVVPVRFEHAGVTLVGDLYVPEGAGPHPAVILMHGGGTNFEVIMDTPRFFGPRLAACGIAALVYHKRGTGDSGGDSGTAVFEDFVGDAVAAAALLAERDEIDGDHIGVLGFSQGGRLAPLVAVQSPHIAFVASVSGPFVSAEETRLYALEKSFRRSQVSEERLSLVMPLWRTHYEAVAKQDVQAMAAMDERIRTLRESLPAGLLPPLSHQWRPDPILNSMGRDYNAGLDQVRVPWLSLWGELDEAVPVGQSRENVAAAARAGGNDRVELRVIPRVGHSFFNRETGESFAFEDAVIAWILEQIR